MGLAHGDVSECKVPPGCAGVVRGSMQVVCVDWGKQRETNLPETNLLRTGVATLCSAHDTQSEHCGLRQQRVQFAGGVRRPPRRVALLILSAVRSRCQTPQDLEMGKRKPSRCEAGIWCSAAMRFLKLVCSTHGGTVIRASSTISSTSRSADARANGAYLCTVCVRPRRWLLGRAVPLALPHVGRPDHRGASGRTCGHLGLPGRRGILRCVLCTLLWGCVVASGPAHSVSYNVAQQGLHAQNRWHVALIARQASPCACAMHWSSPRALFMRRC